MLLCVEGVNNLIILILIIKLTKHLEDLAVTRQIVWVFSIHDKMITHKFKGDRKYDIMVAFLMKLSRRIIHIFKMRPQLLLGSRT